MSKSKVKQEPKEQLSFEIPKTYRREEVDIGRITVPDDIDESFYKGILRSVEHFKDILQDVLLIEEGDSFRIGFGLRRVLAARKAGLQKVPAAVFPAGTPRAVLSSFIVVENMARTPNPAAEALSLADVMEEYGWKPSDVTKHLGVPAPHVSSRIRLLRLIPEFFDQLKRGQMSLSVAKKLCKLPWDKQTELLSKEDLTLQDAESAVREITIDRLIPAELFVIPECEEDSETKVVSLVSDAVTRIEKAIEITRNGRKGKLEKALKILKGVGDDNTDRS